ncbi:ATP-dependent nuclease [Paenibacillus macerans]|uniref:ATP-dependent nuclease n=1 Tax=Paenibacillus macerans TaxID=44252 RepID=UPI0022E7C5C3|nr:AAA family ATPase [Paenibacillus macerans]
MYLRSLKLWNWRKFSQGNNGAPGIEITFNEGLNVLVGENDSGKTAIIDAIKMTLGTNSHDINWLTEQDFYGGSTSLKIECIFRNLTPQEEAYFYEWLTLLPETTELRVIMEAEIYEDINNQRKIKKTVKAGPENLESGLEETVRQLLAITYLKPLRDASKELSPGNNSRIAQVVKNLKEFVDEGVEKQKIISFFSEAFDELKAVLDDPVLSKIESTVDEFFEKNNKKIPEIRNKDMTFPEILRKLELNLGEIGTGLGSSNLLFMAVELLLLKETEIGPKIALIEEIEAHIHPQAQLRVIKHFERDAKSSGTQYIFTSHSPILAASVKLENIILIYNKNAFPMRPGLTKLEEDDYEFLERFLDATKANLFFARGVIFVEGDAENLLLPAIAEAIERPLYKFGVSIVNVGNLAFKRYSSIFLREDKNKLMNFPVSIITDLDIKPIDYYNGEPCYIKVSRENNREIAKLFESQNINEKFETDIYIKVKDVVEKAKSLYKKEIEDFSLSEIPHKIAELFGSSKCYFEDHKKDREHQLRERYSDNIEQSKVFISSPWTLEHSIASSFLGSEFENILLNSHYSEEANRDKQKSKWSSITERNLRATVMYSFMLNNKISKTIIAQQMAKYIIDHRSDIKVHLLSDPHLKHLVDAIVHVTGGEQG